MFAGDDYNFDFLNLWSQVYHFKPTSLLTCVHWAEPSLQFVKAGDVILEIGASQFTLGQIVSFSSKI